MDTLDWQDSLDSTQDELLRRLDAAAAPGAPEGGTASPPAHGAAVATADQQAGHGRHGRVWTAPPGSGLAMSVLLRPTGPGGPLAPAHLSWLSLVASAAVARVLGSLGAEVHVKWPNDVLAEDGRKLVGVLASLGRDGSVVVGMGVNLDHSAGAPVPTATALADWLAPAAVPAPRALAERLRAAVVADVDALAAALDGVAAPVDGTHPALGAVVDAVSTVGRRVRAELPGGEVLEGVATGLGPGGTLRVRPGAPAPAAGPRETLEREISAGDVVHLRGDVRRPR